MTSHPGREEVLVLQDHVELGWIYDKAQEKYFYCEHANNIKARQCPPKFNFVIWDQDFIHQVLEDSHAFKEPGWGQQCRAIKTGYVYLLRGTKVIEITGDISSHHQGYTVSSVNFNYHVDMLIHVPNKLKDNLLSNLKNYVHSVVNDNTVSLLPEELYKDSDTITYIYLQGNDSKKFRSTKHALQEFCRLLKESEVSKYPYSTYLINPVVSNTYASAVKNTKKEINSIHITSIPKVHQSVINISGTLNSPKENLDLGSSSKDMGFKTKNQTVVMSEKYCRSDINYVIAEKDKMQENTNSLGGNEFNLSSTTNIQDCYGSGSFSGKEKLISATGEYKEMGKEGKFSKEISKSQCSNGLQKNVEKSEMTPESQLLQFSQQKNYAKSVNPDQKNEKSSKDNSVIGYALRSRSGVSNSMSSVQVQKQNFQHDLKDYNSVQTALHDSQVISENETIFNSSKQFNECNSNKTNNSQSYSFAESVEDKVTNLSQEIHNSESGKEEAKVSHVSNMCNAPFKSYEVSQKKDEEDFGLTAGYLKPVKEAFNECGMMRKYYGVHSEMKEKTIILLGASGSGKTTLVNFVANYFKGIKSADGELVHVVRNTNDVRSYTTSVTAYTFCSSEHESPITVIDTPGLNDSSGAEVRDHVQSLKTFLANAASQNLEIHGIGFVAQAHLVRLTSSERLVMDYVSTLFGEGIEDHFFTFVTFADNLEMPPVVEAIKNYGVKCNIFLKFNNSSLSNNKTNEIDDLDRVYWRIGSKSWRKCMKSLQNLPALSVNIIKSLQSEVYASTVIDSAERALRTEIKTFIGYMKGQKFMTKEGIYVCEKVWEIAAIVHHFRSTHLSDSNNVEGILTYFAEEVCKDNGIAHYYYMKLLSLAPSRTLLNAGIGIIQSTATVYGKAVEMLSKQRQTCSHASPEFLYCHGCTKDHELMKIKPTTRRKIPVFGSNATVITYQCKECKCEGNLHGEKPRDEDPSEDCLTSNVYYLNTLLEHTRNCISDVIEEFCTPGYLMSEDLYMKQINVFTNYKYEKFINALLHMKLK
ncbi:uncharacterized protein [Cherax quadricarinatus]|uniref:uncharacterized protein isoform X2 n=1 Tax=Cherax quadricarinatus TaxID=27406 RepID=UPI00387EA4F6